jgi:hypothetical protein
VNQDTIPVGNSLSVDVSGSQIAPSLKGIVHWVVDAGGDDKPDSDTLNFSQVKQSPLLITAGGEQVVCAHFKEPSGKKHQICKSILGLWPLKLSVRVPDTVEPKAKVEVLMKVVGDTSGLSLSVDGDGDGKPEWKGRLPGKITLMSPVTGIYEGKAIAVNRASQQGQASFKWVVNARARLDFQVREVKRNLRQPVEFRLRYRDVDDALDSLWIRFPKWSKGDTAFVAGVGKNQEGRKYFDRLPGKPGKYSAEACLSSKDGRRVCQQIPFEVFNAPPVIDLAATLNAYVGEPIPLPRQGHDPDGAIALWQWDMDGDGRYELQAKPEVDAPQYTFATEGEFRMFLCVVTQDGVSAREERRIVVTRRGEK